MIKASWFRTALLASILGVRSDSPCTIQCDGLPFIVVAAYELPRADTRALSDALSRHPCVSLASSTAEFREMANVWEQHNRSTALGVIVGGGAPGLALFYEQLNSLLAQIEAPPGARPVTVLLERDPFFSGKFLATQSQGHSAPRG